jgi:molybdate transport system substrate-binding protein
VIGARRLAFLLVALLIATAGPAGCAAGDSGGRESITVSAAASLTEAFTEIGARFRRENPDLDVTFNFAGSAQLAEQIAAGAPVDVFAAASTTTMDRVVSVGSVRSPVVFATNSAAVAVPPGNPGGVSGLAGLADPEVSVAVCQAEVPCGAVARDLFARGGIEVTPVTLEPDVKSVLAKVAADEVDAGIVYTTDLRAAGSAVESVDVPEAAEVSTAYPIAVTAGAARPDAAQRFVDYVLSGTGSAVLSAAGFGPPGGAQ